MSIKTKDTVEYSPKLSEEGVEDLMGRLVDRY
jgi:hypothetical protein